MCGLNLTIDRRDVHDELWSLAGNEHPERQWWFGDWSVEVCGWTLDELDEYGPVPSDVRVDWWMAITTPTGVRYQVFERGERTSVFAAVGGIGPVTLRAARDREWLDADRDRLTLVEAELVAYRAELDAELLDPTIPLVRTHPLVRDLDWNGVEPYRAIEAISAAVAARVLGTPVTIDDVIQVLRDLDA